MKFYPQDSIMYCFSLQRQAFIRWDLEQNSLQDDQPVLNKETLLEVKPSDPDVIAEITRPGISLFKMIDGNYYKVRKLMFTPSFLDIYDTDFANTQGLDEYQIQLMKQGRAKCSQVKEITQEEKLMPRNGEEEKKTKDENEQKESEQEMTLIQDMRRKTVQFPCQKLINGEECQSVEYMQILITESLLPLRMIQVSVLTKDGGQPGDQESGSWLEQGVIDWQGQTKKMERIIENRGEMEYRWKEELVTDEAFIGVMEPGDTYVLWAKSTAGQKIYLSEARIVFYVGQN